jgi:hypothetical protein
MSKQVDSLRTLVSRIATGGPDSLKARHTERGKMMARDVSIQRNKDTSSYVFFFFFFKAY